MSFAYHYSIQKREAGTAVKEVKGVLSIEGEQLLFEYKLYDTQGTVISTLNKFSIDVRYLKNISFEKGWFRGGTLIIETDKSVFIDPLPGSADGKIELKVTREDRDQASAFVNQLKTALSERSLNDTRNRH